MVLLDLITAWHVSFLNLLDLRIIPAEAANLATLATAVYLLDIGVREGQLWLLASSGACLFKIGCATVINGERMTGSLFGDEMGIGLLLCLFAVILLCAALLWRRVKPGTRDPFEELVSSPRVGPARLESLLFGLRHRQSLLMAGAMVFQVLMMAIKLASANGFPVAGKFGIF